MFSRNGCAESITTASCGGGGFRTRPVYYTVAVFLHGFLPNFHTLGTFDSSTIFLDVFYAIYLDQK